MDGDRNSPDRTGPSMDATADLLLRARAGDAAALDSLLRTFGPLLERWAHGRLPANARGVAGTNDLVQVTLVRVLKQIDRFEARRPGAFLAYLRRSFLNNMRNEIRAASRRPSCGALDCDALADAGPSPLERVVGHQALEAYERALAALNDEQRAAVILKVEMGCGNQEIAGLLGSPSANAARMVVSRALVRLAQTLARNGIEDDG